MILKRNIKTEIGEIWIAKFKNKIKSEKNLELLHFVSNEKNLTILKNENNAPYIPGQNLNISISHSKNLLTIYLSKNNLIGIDIEFERNKIIKGLNYFVNEIENQNFSLIDVKTAHIIWGAKEAFFKMKKGLIIDLKNDVTIYEINENENKISLIYQEVKYKLGYEILCNEIYLVYTLN